MNDFQLQIESLIFASQHPITVAEIKSAIDETYALKSDVNDIQENIDSIIEKYNAPSYPFEVLKIAEGYNFFTKSEYHSVIGSHLKNQTKKKLSRAALETLSIIAYKQPLTKGEMEKIRGVSSDYSVQKLLEKELVEVAGRSDGPGKPLLYKTSRKFMDYFGLSSLSELPKLKEFRETENQIGTPASIDEPINQQPASEKEI